MSLNRFILIAALGSLLMAGTQVGCTEKQLGGKTPEQVFTDPGQAALVQAASRGDLGGVSRAIEAGANPNARGTDDSTALLWAVHFEKTEVIEALLTAGADPNQSYRDSISPVYEAATARNPDVLRILIRHGGNPNAIDAGRPSSALTEAMSLGINFKQWENYYTLLESGANINQKFGGYYTIALYAADMAQYDKLSELLDRGYNQDLTYLGGAVEARAIRADLEPQRAKVKEMLQKRGVKFPVPPMVPPGA